LQIVRRTVHILLVLVTGIAIWFLAMIAVGKALNKWVPGFDDVLITIPLSAYIGYLGAVTLHKWDKPVGATRLDRILIQIGIVLLILLITLFLMFRIKGSS
jgi:ACR3 family arsenite efflux pump ArsB